MWYIFVLFYLYGVASSLVVNPVNVTALPAVNITDPYGTWVPLTPLNWTFAQNCGNNAIMISTTFQLGTNGSYVEKFLVGSGNSTDEEDFINSVVLVIETLGDMNIDYDYENENETSAPVPSSYSIPPNPSSVETPASNEIVPAPMPLSHQPEVQNPEPVIVINQGPNPVNQVPEPAMNQVPVPVMNQVPEPAMNQVPVPVMNQVPEPVMNQVPEPVMNQAPEPVIVTVPGVQPTTEEPAPTSQNPVPTPMKRAKIVGVPPKNATIVPPLMPAQNVTNSTEQVPSPSVNNSTLNATTNFTSQWVHVFFTPKTFNVTILSNETDIYYINNGPLCLLGIIGKM